MYIVGRINGVTAFTGFSYKKNEMYGRFDGTKLLWPY